VFRKLSWVMLLAVLCSFPLSAHAAKDYYAERFDVEAAVEEGGSLQVTETVVFQFEGGPFTYVYRELSGDYTDGIEVIVAGMDGQPLSPGKGSGQFEIKGRDPIKVTWHFSPVSDSAHIFTLTYRMDGVVRQEPGADLLIWDALPRKHDYRIAFSTVRLGYPQSATALGPAVVTPNSIALEVAPGSVTYRPADLGPDDSLRVTLRFAPGSLIASPPAWQMDAARAQASAPGFVVAALAVLAAGWLGLLAYVRRWRREPSEPPAIGLRPIAPPDDLPPALAAAITSSGARPARTHALGALFDLARRGVLRIEESPERKWYRRHEFSIVLMSQPADLRPHERGLLDLLFVTKAGTSGSVKLSDLSRRFSSDWKRFREPLAGEMESGGFLDAGRKRAGTNLLIAGLALVLLTAAAMAVCITLSGRFDGWPFLVGAGVFALSISAFLMSAAVSPLSDAGAREAQPWQGFRQYLRDVTKGREPAWDLQLFERYLPYAASYGLAELWAKIFEKQGGTETPAWFHSLAASPHESMGAFVAMMSASHAAGASSSAGGAGGAAGGGASGAG
jgi:hypothetical protein